MGKLTESQERYAEFYGLVCDVVERAWQNWPVERGAEEAPVMHTSDYARQAANRVMAAFAEFRDVDTRVDDEIQAAEQEFFDRLWYHRTMSVARTADEWAEIKPKVTELEAKYGKDTLALDDEDLEDRLQLGMIEGKLSALRWVLGDEWDMLDT